MNLRNSLRECAVVLGCLTATAFASASDAGLQITDTSKFDELDTVNQAPGRGGVAIFNGNLALTAESIIGLPHDGGLGLGLSRTYNSTNVRRYKVFDNGVAKYYVAGRSWSGLGWTSHLGRIFRRNAKRWDPATSSYTWREDTFFEFPDGSLYRFEPSVVDAKPQLKITYYQGCDPNTVPPGCQDICNKFPESTCCEAHTNCGPDPVERYEVVFPNGTTYRMEKIVPYQYVSLVGTGNWIKNHDRAGYYTTKITDVHGNSIGIEYYRATNATYPEAIKRVYPISPAYADAAEINTTVCGSSDPDPSQCPTGSAGLLKEVRATAFKGGRASAQIVRYKFSYTFVSLTDSDGTSTFPLLKQVSVEGDGGVKGGTTQYSYNTLTPVEDPGTTYGPLLSKVTSPFGGVVKYEYGTWHSGGRVANGATVLRDVVGVVKETAYPSGSGDHALTRWTRSFQPATCPGGSNSYTAANTYEVVGPDGAKVSYIASGDVCGKGTNISGPFGAMKTTTVYTGGVLATATALRTTTVSKYNYRDPALDPDEEIRKVLGEQVVTTFNDDTGLCFGGQNATSAKKITVVNLNRNADDNWLTTVIKSDDYFPLVGTDRMSHLTNRTPHVFSASCDDHNLKNYFDQFYIEEGKNAGSRYESRLSLSCEGDVLESITKNEWLSATTDPTLGTPVTPNAPADTNDLKQAFTYTFGAASNTGNPSQVVTTTSGGDGYPDATSATYSTTTTLRRGSATSVQATGLSYLSSDVTPDATGLIWKSRDANGLETTMDYDALGRMIEVDPPGTVEQKTRWIYPDFSANSSKFRMIRSSGTETDFVDTMNDQLFEETEVDGLGRVIQRWRGMPDGTKSTQVVRYDTAGRVVFTSEWVTADSYSTAAPWQSADRDGDGSSDYTIAGVPVPTANGLPWGTTVFYGTPDPADPTNPLKVDPDGLGRPHRITRADGSSVDYVYCGPHVETTVHGVQTSLAGAASDSVTRTYFDALGRLVLVDAPPVAGAAIGANPAADAEYRYDPRGNLVRVNLLSSLGANPYESWRTGSVPTGQVREFKFDAAGRLVSSKNPEKGTELRGAVDGSGSPVSAYYDSAGNPLIYQDALGIARGYYFKNIFDTAGRLIRVEKRTGTPQAPAIADESRLGADGDNWPLSGSAWQEGTISGDTFSASDSYWRTVTYGGLTCVAPPPGQTSSSTALYFGNPTNCSYADANVPAEPQAVRHAVSGVTRDDVLTFKLWRQVRQGAASLDSFQVFVTLQSLGNDVSTRRIALKLDAQQASFARWQQTLEIQPGDLFTAADWPEGSTANLYLYFVFEKGDTAQSGVGAGVVVDDVFLGRRAVETVAEYDFDVDVCTGTPPDGGAACDGGEETANRYKGQLSQVRSYTGNRLLSRQFEAYKGLNGRPSGERTLVDWAGVGSFSEWATKVAYTSQGDVASWTAPYQPAHDAATRYDYAYRRGFLDTLSDGTNAVPLVSGGTNAPGILYNPAGGTSKISYSNGTWTDYAVDAMSRPARIAAQRVNTGHDPVTLWNSGTYSFDGAGNVVGIGDTPKQQKFAYDLAQRLTDAQVLPQATKPDEAAAYQVSSSFDAFGNMLTQSWQHTTGEAAPPGFNFTLSFGAAASAVTNQVIENPDFAYDLNGALTRAPSSTGGKTAMLWDAQGRLAAFVNGRPEEQNRPTEKYLYGSGGYRLVRFPESGDGRPLVSLRAGSGRTMTEFIDDPQAGYPILGHENVFAGGVLVAERTRSTTYPTLSANSTMSQNGSFGLDVSGMPSGSTFAADIRTAQGFTNLASGLTPDANGTVWIPESALSSNQRNWVRVRRESASPEAYSNPVVISFDPSVNAQSTNQVRSLSVGRTSTTVTIRWKLFQENGKKLRVYFHRADGGTAILLTPQGLSAGTTQFTLQYQALASPCGYIDLTQTAVNGSNETGPSVGADLPGSRPSLVIDEGEPGCSGIPPEPPGPPPSSAIVTTFHHRDHLGSLRVVTDGGGWRIAAHDYYPFGREIEAVEAGLMSGSTSRYTGHERDLQTGLDYMVTRSKSTNYGFFTRPDFIEPASLATPHSWNKNSYTAGNPIVRTDPLGLRFVEAPTDCDDPDTWGDVECEAPRGDLFFGGGGPSPGGFTCFTIQDGPPDDPTPGGVRICLPNPTNYDFKFDFSDFLASLTRAFRTARDVEFAACVAAGVAAARGLDAPAVADGLQGNASWLAATAMGSAQVGMTNRGDLFAMLTLAGGTGQSWSKEAAGFARTIEPELSAGVAHTIYSTNDLKEISAPDKFAGATIGPFGYERSSSSRSYSFGPGAGFEWHAGLASKSWLAHANIVNLCSLLFK